ncbi:hypothetical protein EJO70_14855 [Variovorax sp. 553]|nr:hypothetical protein EJO70_14855 [Variovorax sp. 553]RSZ41934.1 hypothetical protein EJO71_14185 [Variovorax sp. 679]
MANGWTPERRARQAELIHIWRPWEKATGPTSPEGKARVSRNAYTGGHWRTLRQMTKAMREMLKDRNEVT